MSEETTTDRPPKDFAIEFGEYLATAAERLQELDRLKWAAHEKECESAAMAVVKERNKKR